MYSSSLYSDNKSPKIMIYKRLILILFMFSFFTNTEANYERLAYDFNFKNIDGNVIKLGDYKGKVIVVVNVASRCGFTYQYEGLQSLWEKYKNDNLIVLGIPSNNFKQEPGTNKEIKNFCESNFGINFPITEKATIIGEDAHPFYKWAKKNHGISAVPKWNFHKIIIGKNGKVIKTFSSITKPSSSKFIKFIDSQIKS